MDLTKPLHAQHIWLQNFKTTVSSMVDSRKTKDLLEFDKRTVCALNGILMGHCTIGSFADKLFLSHQDYGKSCQNVKETEPLQHFLCECPVI